MCWIVRSRRQGLDAKTISSQKTIWMGVNMIVQNLGAFFGMLAFTKAAQRYGRKPAFAVAFVAAFIVTFGYFRFFNSKSDMWMSAVMGFFQLVFSRALRSIFLSFSRFACGARARAFVITLVDSLRPQVLLRWGKLQASLAAGATSPEAKLQAFRHAACYLSAIFLVGIVALFFLPETKGRPMPEDAEPAKS